jgi:hypothetical protein
MIDLNEVTIRGHVTSCLSNQLNQRTATHSVCYKGNTKEAIGEEFSPEHPHTLLGALQRLQRRLNKVGESMGEQRKWAEAMAQPVEKAQRQEPVETIRDNHLLFHERQQELRTKALELACHLYNTPYYLRSEGNQHIVEVAQRFYTYITKGE